MDGKYFVILSSQTNTHIRMAIFNFLHRLAISRRIRKEQALRERCIQYADGKGCAVAASIYRFIVNGTHREYDQNAHEYAEFVYTNLEGVIHQGENPTK